MPYPEKNSKEISVRKSFVVKLHKILNNSQYQGTISWSRDGMSVVVKSIPKMMQTVLPTEYKHRNYSSFIRQLNTYGFNKVYNQEEQDIYHHEYFNKHAKPNYSKIVRKTGQKEKELSVSEHESSLKELVAGLTQRIEEFEQRMVRKESESHRMILEKLRHLEGINTQLEKKARDQEQLISRILEISQISAPALESVRKKKQKDHREEFELMLKESHRSASNTSLYNHHPLSVENEPDQAESIARLDEQLDLLEQHSRSSLI